VPGIFVQLASLPLTMQGKIDRRALPALDSSKGWQQYVAPRTPTEQALTRIWAEALGVEEVGVEDNFFARGGHSVAAMLVIAQVQEVFAVELPLRALFEEPTVRGLARQIEMSRSHADALPLESVQL
jgi:acyl carrier protein